MLLSPMEIAEVCQEQNAAYCEAIGRPDLADPWAALSWQERAACEDLVKKLLANPALEPIHPKNGVEKIMGYLLHRMVHTLEKL